MEDEKFLEANEQYLEELRHDLENNDQRDEKEKLEINDELSRIMNEVQRCYEKSSEENSKMIKIQMDENKQILLSNQKLKTENYELNSLLENTQDNVRHLQKKMSILQDQKVRIIFLSNLY